MLTAIRTESPENRRINNRQFRNRKRERNPERRKAVKIWCIGKNCSCGCGRSANTPHHPSDDLYKDEWADLSECEPYYHTCHHMHHKGFARCPVCGKWIPKDGECWSCKSPEEREAAIYRRERRRRNRNAYQRRQAKKAYRIKKVKMMEWKKQHQKGTGGAR